MTRATQDRVYAECIEQWEMRLARCQKSVTLPSSLDWEDVRQMVLVQVWSKIHLWSHRRGPRAKWIGRVMTMYLAGLLRPYKNPN